VSDAATQPDTLPLFPLTGVVLLPRGQLPLVIFEPRYLRMADDALSGARTVGIVQPRETHPDPVPADAPVFEVGGAGRITAFAAAGGDRYLITLTGVGRFHIDDELPPTVGGYRRARVSYDRFAHDRDQPTAIAGRDALAAVARRYVDAIDRAVDWEAFELASDEAVVTALAMQCPLAPGEKQALLECADGNERCRLLTSLLEMAIHQRDGDDAPARH
jgi:Lon protease-like protein